MHTPEIVSHPLCPLTQRLRLIAHLAGGADAVCFRDIAYADLPTTLRQVSPSGDLPVLRANGRIVATDADRIGEYLDARLSAGLLPSDEWTALEVREAVAQIGKMLQAMRAVFTARDAPGLEAALSAFFAAAAAAESAMPAFTPGALDRMDVIAAAPLASLLALFPAFRDHSGWGAAPRLAAHAQACARNDIVRRSECADYAGQFAAFFTMTGSAFPTLMT